MAMVLDNGSIPASIKSLDSLQFYPQVYASTEGAAGAINTRGKVGAVGFIPLTIPVSPLGLIKIDEEGGRPRCLTRVNPKFTWSNLQVLR